MPISPLRFFTRGDVLRGIEDASQLGLPVLGSIPEFKPHRGQRLPGDASPEALEAYYHLTDRVRAPDFHLRGRAIVVASAAGGAGSSTTAENLATLLAQSGSRVILVDADLSRAARRRPGDGTSSSGFGGLLANQLMRPANALVHTLDIRLKLLPVGSVAQPSEALLRSSRLPRVVDGLRELADHVIFDAGPAGKALASLTRHADVTLVILKAGATRREQAQRAAAALREANEGLLGFVLNRAPVVMSAPAAFLTVGEAVEEAPAPEPRLEIAVEALLADLEASLRLIRDIRAAGNARTAVEDAERVTAEG